MSAFSNASKVEAEGQRILAPWLRNRFEHVVFNSGGARHLELQKICDAFASPIGTESVVTIELKVEEENKTGNLYLESFSNKSKCNPGWMFKSEAELLVYYFLRSDECYTLKMQRLRRWAFSQETEGFWNISSYPEREQKKREQKNDTWGWCVPITRCLEVAATKKESRYSPRAECMSDPFLRAQLQTREEWLSEYEEQTKTASAN